MIDNAEIETRFALSEVKFVQVSGDGYHYQITVVSDVFLQQSRVNRHKWVYSKLQDWITAGKLHAININALTVNEWEQKNG